MPTPPKPTREEKASATNFTVTKDNLKNATEKQVREEVPQKKTSKKITEKVMRSNESSSKRVEKRSSRPLRSELETIESSPKKATRKKATKKKGTKKKATRKKATKKAKKTTVKFVPPKVKLTSSGYELVITEKPQAALKIANALGKAVQKTINKVPYYEVDREGEKLVVACAVGHLFTLKQDVAGTQVPTFDISWAPNYLARKKDFTKRYHDTILKLAKGASSLTVATDYDIEGEVIGMNVVKYICNQEDASRMKFSTLTHDELNRAYDEKEDHISWGQAIAGETRHHLDWFYGINLSRALMNAVKTTGKFKIMSIGRVQGPALNLIVQKEREIEAFISEPYWQAFITIDDSIKGLELKHNKDLFDKDELPKFENLKGKIAIAETKKKERLLPPNPPFNLTALQTEAYKFHGITPSKTLRSAQSLYLAGIISYPRTSSQKLPKEVGYDKILKKLAKKYEVEKLITRKTPIEGKKEDPAHPSIYPTGDEQILSGDDDKVYKLIVKRFLSLFCDNAIIDDKTVSAEVDKLKFSKKGQVIRKKSWLEIYPSKLKEEKIPDVNGEVEILDSRTEEKETQPPKRFSPASILSEMEKRNLGTKATRSNILDTLQDRGYIEGQSLTATPLGISLIETLEKYSPIIIDEKLTREFEEDMETIQSKKKKSDLKNEEKEIIERAKDAITDIAKDFEKHERKIGSELIDANIEYREKQKIENRIRICPKCNKGHLAITYSKKIRRSFVACDAYPECKNTFTLPPNGIIKKTDSECEECKWPKLMRLAKGRKPWIFCFNPKCPTNASWAKTLEKKE